VADEGDLLEVEPVEKAGEIARQGLVVVAAHGLARLTVAAAVVRHGAKALARQPVELAAPDRRAQGPAVDEDDRLAAAGIAIEELLAVAHLDETSGRAGRAREQGSGGNRR
jgi:hypothetical protein